MSQKFRTALTAATLTLGTVGTLLLILGPAIATAAIRAAPVGTIYGGYATPDPIYQVGSVLVNTAAIAAIALLAASLYERGRRTQTNIER